MNTPCSVFNARYDFGVSLDDDASALEVVGAFGMLLMRGERCLNIQE